MRYSACAVLFLLLAFNSTVTLHAGDSPAATQGDDRPAKSVPKEDNVGKDHLALQGYDTVAYFTTGKAAPGKENIACDYHGHTYRFANATDKKLFLQEPEKYMPEYGGWCATAMADGKKVDIDPANFKITQGRLFLFYKNFFSNAINDWNAREEESTKKADEHWRKIIAP